MEQQELVLTLIRKLCKGIVGTNETSVVQQVFQILLNFGEEEEGIEDCADDNERAEQNQVKLTTILFHLKQNTQVKRADALEYLIPIFQSKSHCTEKNSVISVLLTLYLLQIVLLYFLLLINKRFDSNTKAFNASQSSLLSLRPESAVAEGFQKQSEITKRQLNEDPARDLILSNSLSLSSLSSLSVFSTDPFDTTPDTQAFDVESSFSDVENSFIDLGRQMSQLPEGNSFPLTIETFTEPTHTLENRRTLFGALSHFSAPLDGNQLDMMFSLPPLPDFDSLDNIPYDAPTSLETFSPFSPLSLSLSSPQKNTYPLEIDEFSSPTKLMIESLDSSSSSSQISSSPLPQNIWEQALLPTNGKKASLTWESALTRTDPTSEVELRNERERETVEYEQNITANSHHSMMAVWLPKQLDINRPKKDFFSESGVEVFDSTYKKHFEHGLAPQVSIVNQQLLVEECLCVLQGIPTKHFHYDNESSAFYCDIVRLKSTGYVSLHKLLNDIAQVGTDFKFLESYAAELSDIDNRRGLVCQAFGYSISTFLQFIRACILNLYPSSSPTSSTTSSSSSSSSSSTPRPTVMGIVTHAKAIGAQLSFVRGLCETNASGASLLTYLYNQCNFISHSSTSDTGGIQQQALLRYFLQCASRPYLGFVHNWIVNDPFNEFVVAMSPKFSELSLNPDSKFWLEAFVLKDKEFVPSFLQSVLEPMYYCGMALHILRLSEIANPPQIQSYTKIHPTPPPPLRILYTERALQQVKARNRKMQRDFEKAQEKHIRVQLLLERVEEENKLDEIREASNSQQQAYLKALEEKRKKKRDLFDELEKAANEERDRKIQAKRAERQRDVNTIQNMTNRVTSLPQAPEEDEFTREVIEEAKRELMEKYSLQMSDAEKRLNSLRSDQQSISKWGSPVNPFANVNTEVQRSEKDQESQKDEVSQQGEEDTNVRDENEDMQVDTTEAEDVQMDESNENNGSDRDQVPMEADEGTKEMDKDEKAEDYDSHYTYSSEGGSEKGDVENVDQHHLSTAQKKISFSTVNPVQQSLLEKHEGLENKAEAEEEHERRAEQLNEEEEYRRAQREPLERVVQESQHACVIGQYTMVNSLLCSLLSFNIHGGIESHLRGLRRYLLMDAGDFADQLSSSLFDILAKPEIKTTPHPHELNTILSTSLKVTGYDEDPFSKHISFVFSPPSAPVSTTPSSSSSSSSSAKKDGKAFNPHSLSTLSSFHLDYTVPFPLSLVIDQAAREHYHSLFKFLLTLKRVAYALREIWIYFKRRKEYAQEDPSQMIEIEMYRHEMQHFVDILQEYVINQILDICWKEFEGHLAKLQTGELDLNDLRALHEKYLNKAKSRCMLHKKAAPVAQILHSMFNLILQVWLALRSHPIDVALPPSVHQMLQHTRKSFQKCASFLYHLLSKLSAAGYQPHLQQLLLLINYNDEHKYILHLQWIPFFLDREKRYLTRPLFDVHNCSLSITVRRINIMGDEKPARGSPKERKSVRKMLAVADAPGAKLPYMLKVPITFSTYTTILCKDTEAVWKELEQAIPFSMFRGECDGVVNKGDVHKVIPMGTSNLEPGNYLVAIRSYVDNETMGDIVQEAIVKLKQKRPLVNAQVHKLEAELLASKFTHSSLTLDGSTITLAETVLLANIVGSTDILHKFQDSELIEMVEKTTSSEVEVVEAVNHLQIMRQLDGIIQEKELKEETILSIHKQLMDRLLRKPSEGLPGEYRKVDIQVYGSSIHRAAVADIQRDMTKLYQTINTGPLDSQSFHNFLAEIHSEFQRIHPFRGGNGRIGRIIMNILTLQKGYPIIFFHPEHRMLFNEACEKAHKKVYGLFGRMILEAFYVSLLEYEKVMGPLVELDSLLSVD